MAGSDGFRRGLDLGFMQGLGLDFVLRHGFLDLAGAAFKAGAAAAAGAAAVWAAAGVEITANGRARTAALARMDRNLFMANLRGVVSWLRSCGRVILLR